MLALLNTVGLPSSTTPPTPMAYLPMSPAVNVCPGVDRAGDLGPPGADQSGHADDLPAPYFEGDVCEDSLASQPLYRQRHRAGRGVLLREQLVKIPPDHPADQQVIVERGHRLRRDPTAVAQRGDHVGDREDLLEAMRDEQHCRALVTQGAHHAEQSLDLRAGECRGRLVHDQDPGVERQRLRNLDHLLVGDREPPCDIAGRQPDAEPVEQHGGRGVDGAMIDRSGVTARLPAHEDVLRHREIGEQGRFLVDHCDARVTSIGWAVEHHRLAVDEYRSRVGTVDTGQCLDQRRLARAVLAGDRMHLPREQGDRHVTQRQDAAERLGDVGETQHRPGAASGSRIGHGAS
jgi:hypothetical protein